MKDYSVNYQERKIFITNYTVVDGNIIVQLANGEDYVTSYNEENEQKILEIMKGQVQCNTEMHERLNRIVNKDILWLLLMLGFTMNNVATFINGAADFLSVIALSLTFTAFIVTGIKIVNNLSKKSELKKINYFLGNEQELNNNVRKNKNMLLGVSKKATKQIEQTPIEKPVFDINSIDNYSLRDLKTLKTNIVRITNFDFIEEQTISGEAKGQSLVLAPKKEQDNE